MKAVSATECKTHFGEYLEVVRSEPVLINKNDRPVAVLISCHEYEQLLARENAYWLEEAKKGEASGFLGPKKSMKVLKEALNAQTRSFK